MSYCPECEALVAGDYQDVGTVVPCPGCGTELEVVSIDPVEFDLATSGEEEEEVDDAYGYDDTERDDDEEGADHWDEEDPYSDTDGDET